MTNPLYALGQPTAPSELTDNELIGALMGAQTSQTAVLSVVLDSLKGNPALVQEIIQRYFASKQEAADPEETSGFGTLNTGDHNAIMEFVSKNTPTVEDLEWSVPTYTKKAMLGSPKFLQDWTVESGVVYERQAWRGGQLSALQPNTAAFIRMVGGGGTPYGYMDHVEFDECLFEGWCRWAMRLYGVRQGFRMMNSVIRDGRKEHGMYLSLVGLNGMTPSATYAAQIENCAFRNIPSQSIQMVQRGPISDPQGLYSHETPDLEVDMTPGLPVLVRKCSTVNGSMETGDRPGFDLSFFSARNNLLVDTYLIDDQSQKKSQGFLMAQGFHGSTDSFKRSLSLNNFVFRSGISAQESIHLNAMSMVSLSNGVIDVPKGSLAVIRLIGCEAHYLENITSLGEPVRVTIDGVDAGTVDQVSGAAF
jgi:hypothetical protein